MILRLGSGYQQWGEPAPPLRTIYRRRKGKP